MAEVKEIIFPAEVKLNIEAKNLFCDVKEKISGIHQQALSTYR